MRACHGDTTTAAAALNQLCQTYWYPIYAFIRRRGNTPDDCLDLTQEFFANLLQRNLLAAADRDRGRLRSFLLASVKNFLATKSRKPERASVGAIAHSSQSTLRKWKGSMRTSRLTR